MLALLLTATPATAGEPTAQQWLARYEALTRQAPATCVGVTIPQLPPATPARAFVFAQLAGSSAAEPGILYSKDPIAERFIVLAEDARGCVQADLSGRLVPFADRTVASPLPNGRIPAHLGPTPPVAIVADAKSIRPWVQVMPESEFRTLSARLWVGLGAYTGIITVLLLVGIGFTLWQRSRLALAYVVYLCALQFYQLQAFGLGFAWLPFWPAPEYGRLMQALAAALIVPGTATVAIAFLRPRGTLRRVIIGGVALSALGFLNSAWHVGSYRFAAAVLAPLSVVVLMLLAWRLRRDNVAMRWFAAGLATSMIGGGIQAVSIIAPDAGLPGTASFAFLLGNLLESACWMIALAMHLRAERSAMQQQLIYDATHDPLTGTYSRTYLRQRVADALAAVKTHPGQRCGLLFLDLDRFKYVNDSLGHEFGDQVLTAVARAIVDLHLDSAVIGRFGGDEFLILMRLDSHWSVTEGAAAALVARFKEPILVDDRQVQVTASVGVVPINADYDDVDALVHDADLALYAAKRSGGGRWVAFEPQMHDASRLRGCLRAELDVALRESQLILHYQPIFELASLLPVGFEALLRWRHPRRGLLRAAEFLPLAEEYGLMRPVSAESIELAFRQIDRWQQAGLWQHGEYLSLNVSGQQLADDSLLEQLDGAFERYPVDPGSIRIELPEAVMSSAPDLVRKTLPRLLGRNLLIGVDGFGTGLSPLTLLAEFELDMLKIDARVVAGVAHRGRSQNLARIALGLGQELGSLVIAEGIESRDQLQRLEQLGCRYGQGDLLAAPMPADAIAPWLELWRQEQPCDACATPAHRMH